MRIFIKLIYSLALLLGIGTLGQAQRTTKMSTPFEKNNQQTATYDEIIAFYKDLAKT